MASQPKKPIDVETLERTRRIETRLTKLALALGVDMPSQKPEFAPYIMEPSRLILPSPHTSMFEILAAIPRGWQGAVDVYIGQSYQTTLQFAQPSS